MVFDADNFDLAARLLARFALAENESWANNATNQFLQLFHIELPGTEADLASRFKIIQWLQKEGSSEYNTLAIKACYSALTFGHFNRTGSPIQGFQKSYVDYRPDSFEVQDYCKNVVSTLREIMNNNNMVNIEKEVKGVFQHRIREIASMNFRDDSLLRDIVGLLTDDFNTYSLDLYETISKIIAYNWVPYKASTFKTILEKIGPIEFKDRLASQVSNNVYHHIYHSTPTSGGEGGSWEQAVSKQVESLVEEALQDSEKLKYALTILSTGEHRSAFEFGKLLALKSANIVENTNAIVDALSCSGEAQNPNMLLGFLDSTPSDIQQHVMTRIKGETTLRKFYTYSLAKTTPDFNAVFDCLALLQDWGIHISSMDAFNWGEVISNFKEKEILKLVEIIFKNSDGFQVGIMMLSLQAREELNRSKTFKVEASESILKYKLILDLTDGMDMYRLVEILKQGLLAIADETGQKKIIVEALSQCIERGESANGFPGELCDLIYECIRINEEAAFSVLKVLLADSIGFRVNFGFNFMPTYGHHSRGGLFAHFTDELIFLYIEKASLREKANLASYLYVFGNEPDTLSPKVNYLLDSALDLPILRALESNLGTTGSIGSHIGVTAAPIAAISSLQQHSNPIVRKWASAFIKSQKEAVEIIRIQEANDSVECGM